MPKRGKLSSIGAKKESISKRNLKRQDLGCLSDIPSRDLTLARQLLTNFNDLGSELQNRILDAVEDCVQKDKELLSLAIRQ